MTDYSVSIVITTLNRCDDLRVTLSELLKLDPAPSEILVCLDGCTDGSAAMLRDFPSVKVIANKRPSGSVYSRDRLFRMARGSLIVSLDDDSFPTQRDFIARLSKCAKERPETGVFSFQEVRPDGRDDRPFASPTKDAYIASYANCAGAVRAELYGEKASYPLFFFHMYEEPDFCLQAYASGYAVQHVPSLQILHRYSHVGRDLIKRHHQHARNELLSVLMRCPFPHILWVAAYRILRQLMFAAYSGRDWVVQEPVWWFQAIKTGRKALRCRKAIPWSTYWHWMRLARHPLPADKSCLVATFPAAATRLREAPPNQAETRG